MYSWPTHGFRDDIVDAGCICIGQDSIDGEEIEWYLSYRGNKKVQINITDDEITTTTIQEYLRDLELEDLIDRKYNSQEF